MTNPRTKETNTAIAARPKANRGGTRPSIVP